MLAFRESKYIKDLLGRYNSPLLAIASSARAGRLQLREGHRRTLIILIFFLLSWTSFLIGLPRAISAEETFKRYITVYGAYPLLEKFTDDIAKNYSLVITDSSRNLLVATLKNINPDIRAIFYRDLNGIHDYYGDWVEASKHPAWFVRDAVTKKRIVRKGFLWYLMDITNPEFSLHLRRFISERLAARAVFDGVFLDDAVGSIHPGNFVIEGTETPATFDPTYLEAYRDALTAFLQELKAAIEPKLVVINGDPSLVHAVDGVMLEGLFHASWDAPDKWKDIVSWLDDAQTLAKLAKLNKFILVHSGSLGNGEALQRQFLFCFASFLLHSNQNTYFFFDTPTSMTQLPPFPQYTQGLGSAIDAPSPSSITTTVTERSLSSSLSGWAVTSGVSLVQGNGTPTLQFVSKDSKGATMARCIDLSRSSAGNLNISCSAKASNVVAGDVSWMRFAAFGKFYDKNNKLLLAGADLPFDLGTYDWKAYNTSYTLPPGTDRYCVTVGFCPSSLGTGWVQDLHINSVVPDALCFKRTFQKATIFVNPSNVPVTTGSAQYPTLQPQTGLITVSHE